MDNSKQKNIFFSLHTVQEVIFRFNITIAIQKIVHIFGHTVYFPVEERPPPPPGRKAVG